MIIKIIRQSIREMMKSPLEITCKVVWTMSNIARRVICLRLVTDVRWNLGNMLPDASFDAHHEKCVERKCNKYVDKMQQICSQNANTYPFFGNKSKSFQDHGNYCMCACVTRSTYLFVCWHFVEAVNALTPPPPHYISQNLLLLLIIFPADM